MADALCTIAQVKARIFPAGVSDTNDDTLLTELVEEVSGWVEAYTGRKLVPEAGATYRFDTSYGLVLRIPRGIRAITTLKVATSHQPDSGGTYTTVTSADYLLRPKAVDLPEGWPATEVHFYRGAITGSLSRFYDAQNGAEIVGDFGFAATPKDVEAVAIDAVVAAYQSRKNGASSVLGADDQALPPWSRFFGRGSPQRGTLERYRYGSV